MENLFDTACNINKLVDDGHVIAGGSLFNLFNVVPIQRVMTDGADLVAVGGERPRTTASYLTCPLTGGWVYDLTDGKIIYGSLPSNCSSKSRPDQDMP